MLRRTTLAVILFCPLSALAAGSSSTCFDFSQVIKSPLGKPLPFPKARATAQNEISGHGKFGEKENKEGHWGAARGIIELPIQQVYAKLLEHYTIKDPKKVKLRTYAQEQPGYLDYHLVMINAHPAPMVHIDWEENWAYALLEGTREDPKKILVSWQKVAGTQFIKRLCGSIQIQSVGPNATDVYLYEEISATAHRSSADSAKGHLGTLATLRRKN